jgi:signal transduction histidine kinase/ActR/RegA family two-component response regulator
MAAVPETLMPASPASTGHATVQALLADPEAAVDGLGRFADWPSSLRVLFGMMLDAKQPMSVVWGDERRLLYNDAYVQFLGGKHPWAFGRKFDEVWPEIWDDIGPLVDRARSGEALHLEDVPLTIQRGRGQERAWFTFFFTPARDADGRLCGMYSAVVETTARVLGEKRQALLLQLSDALANLRSPDDALAAAAQALVGHLEPVSGCLAVDPGEDGMPMRLAEIAGSFGVEHWREHLTLRGLPAPGRPAAQDPVSRHPPPGADRHGADPADAELFEVRLGAPASPPSRLYFTAARSWSDADAEFAREVARRVGAAIEQWETANALRELTETLEAKVTQRTAELATARADALRIAERLQLALDAAQIGDWDLDLVTDAAYRSLRHDQCFGYDEPIADWGFETFIRHVHPDDRDEVERAFRNAVAELGIWKFECRVIWPDGSLHWIAAYGSVYERDGVPSRMSGVVMDITARKAVDEELRQSSRRKDEFLAMLAHELRNPLAPIATAARLLQLAPDDASRVQASSQIISRQLAHITALVDDLLDVSRVTRGQVNLDLAPVDMRAVVGAAVEQVRPLIDSRGHALQVSLPPEPQVVLGDRTRLVQIVANLLSNAAKYTPDGGDIRLEVSAHSASVRLRVSDTGIGISPALMPVVFDLFTQGERTPDRSQGGLGIGLSLVKRLVEMHGGEVGANSAGPGRGSTLTVSLPRHATPHLAPPVPEDAPSASPRHCARVLIVDDNEDAANTTADLLRMSGHEAAVAHSAHDALGLDMAGDFDTYVLDIGLPDMSGHELALRLRGHQRSDALFIAATGYGQAADRSSALEAGFDHHLVKPVDPTQLLALIGRARRRASPR